MGWGWYEEKSPDFELRGLDAVLFGGRGEEEKERYQQELEDEGNVGGRVEEEHDRGDEDGHGQRIQHVLNALKCLPIR